MNDKTILDEAAEIVDGARQAAYGHPRDNHGCTGEFWTSYLKRRGILAEGAALDARDVCNMNILQKESREANSRKRDNLVDIAGFARNAEMVSEEEDDPLRADIPAALLDKIRNEISHFQIYENAFPVEVRHNRDELRDVDFVFGIKVTEWLLMNKGSVYLISPHPHRLGWVVETG